MKENPVIQIEQGFNTQVSCLKVLQAAEHYKKNVLNSPSTVF